MTDLLKTRLSRRTVLQAAAGAVGPAAAAGAFGVLPALRAAVHAQGSESATCFLRGFLRGSESAVPLANAAQWLRMGHASQRGVRGVLLRVGMATGCAVAVESLSWPALMVAVLPDLALPSAGSSFTTGVLAIASAANRNRQEASRERDMGVLRWRGLQVR